MNTDLAQGHPLDGCPDDELYKIMMSERTDLIKARREAEDTLIKTIIQISSGLITLSAGFVSMNSVNISPYAIIPLCSAFVGLLVAVISGLSENILSSKAYSTQQKNLEDYFSKRVSSFDEPSENKYIRLVQKVSFAAFTLSLLAIGIFGIIQAGG